METTENIWNRRFILLFITNLLVLAAFYASIPIIPVYCQEIGITGSRVGIVLTAMSVATVLFRPVAGYLLDNFNRYRVYLLFLALFCLSFPAFIAFPVFGLLIIVRLYMGVVYSVCASATMTLAPCMAAVTAAESPAAPEPTTSTSTFTGLLMMDSLLQW